MAGRCVNAGLARGRSIWLAWIVVGLAVLPCAAQSTVVIAENSLAYECAGKIAAKCASKIDVSVDDDPMRLSDFRTGDVAIVATVVEQEPLEAGEDFYGVPTESLMRSGVILGQAKVAVVANVSNPVLELGCDELRQVLVGGERTTSSSTVPAKRFRCYGESHKSLSQRIVQRKLLRKVEEADGIIHRSWHDYRKDYVECAGRDEVIRRVREDAAGIGFVLYQGQELRGVKVLRIRGAEGAGAARPQATGYRLVAARFVGRVAAARLSGQGLR